MEILFKFLASKFTGEIGTRIGIAVARLYVRCTKTRKDDMFLVDLGLMTKEEMERTKV